MAKIGLLQKQRKAALALKELQFLVDEFGHAMFNAYPGYVAKWGRTPRMREIWVRYMEWNKTYEKDFV